MNFKWEKCFKMKDIKLIRAKMHEFCKILAR